MKQFKEEDQSNKADNLNEEEKFDKIDKFVKTI